MTTFLRLLTSSISQKGGDLHQQIAILNGGMSADAIFLVDTTDFTMIPGSPFAYWADRHIFDLFQEYDVFENESRVAKQGLASGDDFRFLRLWWEISIDDLASPRLIIDALINKNDTYWLNKKWFFFAKGGAFAKYFSDIFLTINWENDGSEIRTGAQNNSVPGARPQNLDYKFLPGLTWSLRTTSGLSVRPLPLGCLFGHKGPTAFITPSTNLDLLVLLGVMNSQPFLRLIELQLGAATAAAKSYEVGVIQRTPVPGVDDGIELQMWTAESHELARQPFITNEITHVFCMPAILSVPGTKLGERLQALAKIENVRQGKLADLQIQIDSYVAELYGVPELARASTEESWGEKDQVADDEASEKDEDDEAIENVIEPTSFVADLVMWSVGVAFGRWDVRKALNLSRLPELSGPFDPLPVCSPGMLTGSDDLPIRSDKLPSDYPLPVAWDGFLVDDPDHPRDIVSSVERILKLFWPGRLEEVEREACEILGVPDLRGWIRDPRGFFAYHTKRYSKSRRKAPIYWPLQSAKRNYTIWLFYPRLSSESLYHAGREYADAKLKLETGRLIDWQRSLVTTSGSAHKLQERMIASQEALADELKAFVKVLDAAAFLELKPDLNDGVLLNVAPLHELVPWKEASRVWGELLSGKYEWSSIGKQLRQKRLVKNTNKIKEAK